MRPIRSLSMLVICALALAGMLQTTPLGAASAGAAQEKRDRQARPQPANDGERVFQQNCSRCHTAPEGFPTSISGTIVRHMRVRANLSQEDERAILKFFNP